MKIGNNNNSPFGRNEHGSRDPSRKGKKKQGRSKKNTNQRRLCKKGIIMDRMEQESYQRRHCKKGIIMDRREQELTQQNAVDQRIQRRADEQNSRSNSFLAFLLNPTPIISISLSISHDNNDDETTSISNSDLAPEDNKTDNKQARNSKPKFVPKNDEADYKTKSIFRGIVHKTRSEQAVSIESMMQEADQQASSSTSQELVNNSVQKRCELLIPIAKHDSIAQFVKNDEAGKRHKVR